MKPRRALLISARTRIRGEERATADELLQLDTSCRPKKRGDCAQGLRPCPYVSCSMNLYLEVDEETGSLRLNFPNIDPSEMVDSCALDVAGEGGLTLEEVGTRLNITRERVRQLEVQGMRTLRDVAPSDDEPIDDYPAAAAW